MFQQFHTYKSIQFQAILPLVTTNMTLCLGTEMEQVFATDTNNHACHVKKKTKILCVIIISGKYALN